MDLHGRLVADLRRMIVEGELADGARIGEAALCAAFGVSRTPLREALKALAVEGLVTLSPNRGACVTPWSSDSMVSAFEAKGAIERLIGAAAAERATAAEIDALAALHLRMAPVAEAGDAATYTAMNHEFHGRLAAMARNPWVDRIYATLSAHVMRARRLLNIDPTRIAASHRQHDAIVRALAAHAPLDLADRLVRHNDDALRSMMALVGDGAAETENGSNAGRSWRWSPENRRCDAPAQSTRIDH